MATGVARQRHVVLLSLYKSCQWNAESGQAFVLSMKTASPACSAAGKFGRAISYYVELNLPRLGELH